MILVCKRPLVRHWAEKWFKYLFIYTHTRTNRPVTVMWICDSVIRWFGDLVLTERTPHRRQTTDAAHQPPTQIQFRFEFYFLNINLADERWRWMRKIKCVLCKWTNLYPNIVRTRRIYHTTALLLKLPKGRRHTETEKWERRERKYYANGWYSAHSHDDDDIVKWQQRGNGSRNETEKTRKKNQNATEYEKIMLKHLLRNVIIPERVCLCACWAKFYVPRFGIIHVACGTDNWQPEESGTTNKMMKFDVIQLGYTMPFRAVPCRVMPRCAMVSYTVCDVSDRIETITRSSISYFFSSPHSLSTSFGLFRQKLHFFSYSRQCIGIIVSLRTYSTSPGEFKSIDLHLSHDGDGICNFRCPYVTSSRTSDQITKKKEKPVDARERKMGDLLFQPN